LLIAVHVNPVNYTYSTFCCEISKPHCIEHSPTSYLTEELEENICTFTRLTAWPDCSKAPMLVVVIITAVCF